MPMLAIAVLSTGIYFAGLVYFKLAAERMHPLAGNHPWQLAAQLLQDRVWLVGASFLLVGACVQAAALTGLSVVSAQPMFLAGLGMLLILGLGVLGERLTLREWGCVLILAAAAAMFGEASDGAHDQTAVAGAPPWLVVSVALPSLLVPVAALLASDLSRKGLHSRPLTGVALAINVGLLTGTAELMLTGAADLVRSPRELITTPYLYVFVVVAPFALAQLQIALQRNRMVITGFVATATAKTYLFVLAGPLYHEWWPEDRGRQVAVALTLSVLAIAAVPHHERKDERQRQRHHDAGVHGHRHAEGHLRAEGHRHA
ncbi:hypothetical protein J4573_42775 [Actinomadura barringtoniae]|uniref:Uncharacterized protein n=1 Tax=Actinomadura barringtoniae TaxID=1427535 RepID=A0A939TBT7_9ACTN|nr:hypothetical protein [Actinomadura barringtoniae]MBO2453877.1 hypothetical protein [Actinomadura barringtoniae]